MTVIKKLCFPICIIIFAILLTLQSCEKKEQRNQITKHNTADIDSLLNTGHRLYENANFDSSYYYYSKAKYAAEVKKDTSRIIHSLSWMAEIQRNQGDYTGSESTSVEAFPYIGNSNKYPYGETNIYNGLGSNYLFTSDNDNAIYYYRKAINYKTDEVIKAGIINNIALIYIEKREYKKAIQIFLSLISKKKIKDTPETYARLNDNLGNTYNKSNNNLAFYHLMDIPLQRSPRFRYKVRHPFRYKGRHDSAGKVATYSGAKYATLLLV
ncbi:M48 family metallopeptidase [Flavobacterium sp. K5-23]|uniref:tetratricopeptide repeat protein n=1 Tax=Flavobacterium sp. K5-23 TaxID=2746225 RepID=UPI00200F041C|nr:hypothetical protein [Flavobacterium sp. K5-23]UQD57549.1 hypothetical protein FLAK523_14605 [Flavobacterium sp. K5-23]